MFVEFVKKRKCIRMDHLRKPILVSEAVKRVMEFSTLGEKEYIDILDAEKRYLAEDIVADHSIPPFDKAPLDGFAIRSEDSQEASSTHPILLEVVETVGAGHIARKEVEPGQAIRIMTGAMMPKGADAHVMFELAKEKEIDGKKYIEIKRSFRKGESVSYKGSETEEGEIIVTKGSRVSPGVMAVLATFGYKQVPVVKKPVVGVFATGTELLEVDEELEPGKIRNSNAYMVQSQIRQVGGEPMHLGVLFDDFDQCFQAIKDTLPKVDALITTGGVSLGDFDYLPRIYEKLGANILFNKVAMRPGSVTTVAELNGKLLFGLSGNPSACFVGFELYARPWIKHFLHSKTPYIETVKGKLTVDFPKRNPFTRYIRSKVSFGEDGVTARPIGLDKSMVVTSLAYSDALVAVPGGTNGYKMGDEVDILLLDRDGSSIPLKDPVKIRRDKDE